MALLGPRTGPAFATHLNARYPASTMGAVRWHAGVLLLGDTFLGVTAGDAEDAIRALPPVSTAEAAARLGCTPSYVRRLIREGRIGADLDASGAYRVRLDWLNARLLATDQPRRGNPQWRMACPGT